MLHLAWRTLNWGWYQEWGTSAGGHQCVGSSMMLVNLAWYYEWCNAAGGHRYAEVVITRKKKLHKTLATAFTNIKNIKMNNLDNVILQILVSFYTLSQDFECS